MAAEESINQFVSQGALKQLDDLKAKIDASAKSMEVLISQTAQYNNEISKASNLNDYNKAVELSKRATVQLTQEQKELLKTNEVLEKSVAKLALSHSEEGKELAILKAQTDAVNKANRDAAKSVIEEIDAYTKLVRAQKAAEKEYLNLAAAQGVESKAAQEAAVKNKALFDEISKIEQGGGNFKRNVGNYTSGFQSFSQVLKEAPAFAVNANTGFLALSNNIPILADDIKRARDAGASMGQIFKGLGATLFSFGGIITIATTILTFLPKILSSSGDEAKKASEGLDEFADSLDAVTQARLKGSQNAQGELAELKLLYDAYTNANLPLAQRRDAYKELQDKYPAYFGNLQFEEKATNKTKDAYNGLANSIIAVGKARAIADKVAANEAEKLANEAKIADLQAKALPNLKEANRLRAGAIKLEGQFSEFGEDRAKEARDRADLLDNQTAINKIKERNNKLDADNIKLQEYYNSVATEGLKIKDKEDDKAKKKEAKITHGTTPELQQIEKIGAKTIEVDGQIKQSALDVSEFKRRLREHEAEEAFKAAEKQRLLDEENARLQIELIRTLADSISSIISSGFDRQKNAIQGQIDANDKLKEAEIARVAASTESEQVKADKIAIINAKAQAQKEQLEAKQRGLDQKKAQAEKANSIFQIVLNTAIAVSKQLAAGNVLGAALVGSIGAAQLATVLARPIPKFAKGTNYSPEGMAWVGEKGTEIVQTPSGHQYLTPNTATLTYLEKGSKVIPNHKLNGMALDGLAGITRYKTDSSNDYKILAKATSESADKITKAIKSQPVTQITEGGMFQQYQQAQKLNRYLKRNLR